MKFVVSQLSHFYKEREVRRNLAALAKYLLLLFAVMLAYTVVFHYLMLRVEGKEYSWLTGFYWTLTVMSTLGFGDITFHTDAGRLFSILVLVTGIVLVLIMLPFTFIRYFYAPWLEAQLRNEAPRAVDPSVRDHVLICHWDSIARGLIKKLDFNRIPYFVLEPDPVEAARLKGLEVSVITGEIDSRRTYERARVQAARMVVANAEDTTNTNITLTVREIDPRVPICAFADQVDSVDILELSGATHVLALKQKLGQHLAARVTAGTGAVHVVGRFQQLEIAEFVVHETALAGQTLEEAGLEERTGVSVVGIWQRGRLVPARPGLRLSTTAVPVVIGNHDEIGRLNRLLASGDAVEHPVLVIGGGKVGRATAAALAHRGVPVTVVEKNAELGRALEKKLERVVHGDAADREVLLAAGLAEAGAVALTTNDDAVNIHLTVYCRRLESRLNIVSRITHERNIEAIYRAGADSALSYASLGREAVIARLQGREPVMVGEGADFFLVPVPAALAGDRLADGRIGERTGLIVIAIENGQGTSHHPAPATPLPAGGRLLMLGTTDQRQAFAEKFE